VNIPFYGHTSDIQLPSFLFELLDRKLIGYKFTTLGSILLSWDLLRWYRSEEVKSTA